MDTRTEIFVPLVKQDDMNRSYEKVLLATITGSLHCTGSIVTYLLKLVKEDKTDLIYPLYPLGSNLVVLVF
jgi:hypothetical protein